MSYDGMVTRCVTEELNRTLTGGKVEKIYQPERDELLLLIRTREGAHRLLLSASASNPRVHLTQLSRENPMTPPMFCMLMRKRLQGSKVLGVTQTGFDRVIRLELEARNELGDLCRRTVVTEIMGRHSNIILLDENNRIMDSAKHVDFTVSALRQVLPGLLYEAPPPQNKLNPDDYSLVELLGRLDRAPEDTLLDRFLLDTFTGMSPLLAREIVYRFGGHTKVTRGEADTAAFLTHADGILKELCAGRCVPTLVLSPGDGKPTAFSCLALTQYENQGVLETGESMSQVIDSYYEKRAQQERMSQRMAALLKLVRNNIDRCEKKIAIHSQSLADAKGRDTYKVYGDLLTANLYRMEPGMKALEAQNYYDPAGGTVTIPLKEELPPSQNAQRYYRLYAKAKNTEKYAAAQKAEAEAERTYLLSVQSTLEKAETPADLIEIREELAEEGYLPKTASKGKQSQKRSEPMRFVSSDGFEILVGRNNKQNDTLTVRMAYSTDLWFHTKVIPGSHTIVRTQGGKAVPDRTVLEAARLAAWYSQARESSKVPVDYTQVKNVRKPNGAKPGMVIYDHYETILVEPGLLPQAE